jgi:tetratricopeptide (TPR) repeat protein
MEPDLRQILDQAVGAFQGGDYETAERLLLALVDHPPVYANVHNMLGFIYSHRGLPEKAVEQFRRALEINPNYTEAQLNLAITLADIGVYDQALAEYRTAQDREQQAASTTTCASTTRPWPNTTRPWRGPPVSRISTCAGRRAWPRKAPSTRRTAAWYTRWRSTRNTPRPTWTWA